MMEDKKKVLNMWYDEGRNWLTMELEITETTKRFVTVDLDTPILSLTKKLRSDGNHD